MAIEESPIYETLIREMGSPIQVPPMDCSYGSVVESAGFPTARTPEASAPMPAPAKLSPRSAQKQMSATARKNAS